MTAQSCALRLVASSVTGDHDGIGAPYRKQLSRRCTDADAALGEVLCEYVPFGSR